MNFINNSLKMNGLLKTDALDRFLLPWKEYGAFFIRLIVGFHLMYGVADNILSWERMIEFSRFLEVHGYPLPLAAAVISVVLQFVCGLFFIAGFLTRWSALVMVINFIIALKVHVGDTYPGAFPALMMLSASVFLLLNGPGRPAVDSFRQR